MNFKRNFIDLITTAYRYQYIGITDSKEVIAKKKPFFFFLKIQWVFIILSIVISPFIKKGFSNEFSGYIISGLSLFIGIFFTFILELYNKFNNIDFNQYKRSVNEEKFPLGVRLKNYFKKITVLSLYSIIISIICILLLSCSLLFETYLQQEISICYVIKHWKSPSFYFIFIYRSIVLYFLFDFLLITLFLVSSFYDFIISEYENIKLS